MCLVFSASERLRTAVKRSAAEVFGEHLKRGLTRMNYRPRLLRFAQLQLLHGDYPDPRQWAAFTLNGDPQGRWNSPAR